MEFSGKVPSCTGYKVAIYTAILYINIYGQQRSVCTIPIHRKDRHIYVVWNSKAECCYMTVIIGITAIICIVTSEQLFISFMGLIELKMSELPLTIVVGGRGSCCQHQGWLGDFGSWLSIATSNRCKCMALTNESLPKWPPKMPNCIFIWRYTEMIAFFNSEASRLYLTANCFPLVIRKLNLRPNSFLS